MNIEVDSWVPMRWRCFLVEEREEPMHPAEEHIWKTQYTTEDVLVRMVDLMNGEKPWMRTSWLDQARPQQGFWLGKSLNSIKEDVVLKWLKAEGVCERGEMRMAQTEIKMDVPQGSILGLLLYASYVNNLPESVD